MKLRKDGCCSYLVDRFFSELRLCISINNNVFNKQTCVTSRTAYCKLYFESLADEIVVCGQAPAQPCILAAPTHPVGGSGIPSQLGRSSVDRM